MEYCFALWGSISTQHTWKWNISVAVSAEIFQRILLCPWCNMCTQYTWQCNISAAHSAEIHQGILLVAWGTCTLNPCESESFQQHMVPKSFGKYSCAFRLICTIKEYKDGIFRQLLLPKYFGECCFAVSTICALNTCDNVTFQQLLVLKYSRECCLLLREHVHWMCVKMKYFGRSWCWYISENIVLPSQ